MNLKLKIIAFVIVFCVFTCGSGYSQGLFKNQSTSGDNTSASGENTSTNSGALNAPALAPPPPIPGGGVPGEESSPIGEGFVILSLLSGGYFMLKRKKNSQK